MNNKMIVFQFCEYKANVLSVAFGAATARNIRQEQRIFLSYSSAGALFIFNCQNILNIVGLIIAEVINI